MQTFDPHLRLAGQVCIWRRTPLLPRSRWPRVLLPFPLLPSPPASVLARCDGAGLRSGVPAGSGLCHPRRWHRLRRLCRPCWGRARRWDGGWGPTALGGQASLRNVCEKARDVGKGARELAPAVNSLSSSVPLREGDTRQGPRRLGVRVGSSVGAKVHGAHHQPISTSPFQG